jgi:hypothetical protein
MKTTPMGAPGEFSSGPASPMVYAESTRGSAHEALGLPNQDSYLTSEIVLGRGRALVVAVADGHGNRRHFRSGLGSRFAVQAACECVAAAAERIGARRSIAEIEGVATDVIIPAILDRWRAVVADDVTSQPFSADEEQLRAEGDAPDVAYGSTLLVAVWLPSALLCIQIGDGDIVCVQPDGSALLPVPDDPSLDGHRTTSLCQTNALDAFRLGTVDRSTSTPVAVILATDGYGNAQVAEPWEPVVSADLAKLLHDHSPDWVGGRLREWTARCASSDGSGDDTTVALIIAADGPVGPAPRVRSGRARPRWLIPVAMVVVAVAAVVVLGVVLSSDGGTGKAPAKGHARTPVASISVHNPLTGAKISVPLPPRVGVGPYVQEGKWLFVLSDDRVWQITIAKPSEVRSSVVLESPGPPMSATASTVTVSGFDGKVKYRVDTKSLAVQCVPESVPKTKNGTSSDLCPVVDPTATVS